MPVWFGRNWLSSNCEKCNNNSSEDYSITSYASSDLDKTLAKFQNDPGKTVGGAAFTVTQCLNALSPKIYKVWTAKKNNKNYLRITAKRHAHFQALTKTPAKFQKDSVRSGEVVFTRYPVSKCFKPKTDKVATAKKLTKIWGSCTSSDLHENTCEVSNRSN